MAGLTSKQILEESWARIENPAHWCTGEAARNKEGIVCAPNDPEATQWCAVGSLWVGTDDVFEWDDERREALRSLDSAAESMYNMKEAESAWATSINDNEGHQAVKQMYEIAIEMSELPVSDLF